ncbi:MAG: carboxypeptidase-like regulatory domain-containing protein [Myxococcaceae bacterium]|nr:carboxypeptidase-like regulatory domain-containing protein [Myxococcaceae bacterium]
MRRALVASAVAVVVLGAAGAAWWWSDAGQAPGTETGGETPAAPKAEVTVDELEAPDAEQAPTALTVQVVDENGAPQAGAEVVVREWDASALMRARSPDGDDLVNCVDRESEGVVLPWLRDRSHAPKVLAQAVTGPDGRVTFPALQAAEVGVFARKGALAGETLTEGLEGDLELTVAPARRVAVSLANEGGEPVAQAQVELIALQTLETFHAVTDAQGVGVFQGLTDGATFRLIARASGFASMQESSIVAGPTEPDDTLAYTLEQTHTLIVHTSIGERSVDAELSFADQPWLPAGGLRTSGGVVRVEGLVGPDVEVTARSGALVSPATLVSFDGPEKEVTLELRGAATLVLSVTGPDGQPVQASASLRCADGNFDAEAETEGALLTLGPLAEGACELDVSAPAPPLPEAAMPKGSVDQMIQLFDRPRALQFHTALDLGPGERHLEVVLQAPPEEESLGVSGLVVDEAGRPVSGATVDGDGKRTSTGADGAFTLSLGPGGTSVELVAAHPEAGTAEQTVPLPSSRVRLQLRRQGTLEVTVTGLDGPEDVAAVRARPQGAKSAAPLESGCDERGLAHLELPVGTYEIRAYSERRAGSVAATVEVRQGAAAQARLELLPGASLTGQLIAQGGPLPDVTVQLVPPSAAKDDGLRPVREAEVGADGHFVARGLTPGLGYALLVVGDVEGWDVETPKVPVAPGGQPLKIMMRRRALLHGRVVDELRKPVAEFSVGGVTFDEPGGTFEVPAPRRSQPGEEPEVLVVSAEGYQSLELKDPLAAELGDLVLRKAPELRGVVVTADGQPVPGAEVSLVELGGTAMTSADGTFHLAFDPWVQDPPYRVSAHRGSRRGEATAQPGQSVRLVLEPAVHLTGVVVDERGKGQAAAIQVTADGDELTARSGSDGRFELDVPVGQLELRVPMLEVSRVIVASRGMPALVLGPAPGSCSIEVDWDEVECSRAELRPVGNLAADGTTHTLVVMPDHRAYARGVPCGAYLLDVSLATGSFEQPVEVRGDARVHLSEATLVRRDREE